MKFIIFYILICSVAFAADTLKESGERINEVVAQIEEDSGCKLIVTSGYRDEKKNKEVGGAPKSLHLKNLARDIVPKDNTCSSLKDLWKISCKYATGILEKDHIHVDLREKKKCFKLIKK
jgi:uncharacterized protein YcbK (DUF882 family)